MNDVLELAEKYRLDVERKTIAHEISSEWHRHRGAQLGTSATVLSAVVGTSIFTTIATKLQAGKLDFSNLGPWESLAIFLAFGLVLVLSPILTSMQRYLRHPEQAATHKDSYVGYCRLKQRLDIFYLRYKDGNSGNTDRVMALQELDEISKDIQKVAASSITLTKKAYARADERLGRKKPKPWWKFWKKEKKNRAKPWWKFWKST